MNRRGFLLTVAGGLILAGCGGGSGGDGDDGGASPETRMVQLQAGQSWNYSGNFTYNPVTGQDVTGALTMSIVCREIQSSGNQALVLEHTITNTTLGTTETLKQFVFQNANRDVVLYGVDDAPLAHDVIILPGEWRQALNLSDAIITDDTESYLLVVEGAERTTVSSRLYDVWKCRLEKQSSSSHTVGTYRYAPEVGMFVEATYTTTNLDGEFIGDETSVHLSLVSSTL